MYGVDRNEKYYIMRKSTETFSTAAEAAAAADRHPLDIPCCHGGPFLLVVEKRMTRCDDTHLSGVGKMLTDDARGCQFQ